MSILNPIIDPVEGSASPEVPMNDALVCLEWAAVYGYRASTSSGLTWGYYGGRWGGNLQSDGTFALADNNITYIVAKRSDGVTSASTSDTNWNDTDNYARVYRVTTAGGLVTAANDHRAGPNGIHAGIPREAVPLSWRDESGESPQQATLEIGDAENGVRLDYSSANSVIVPPNASVAFDVGTSVLIKQQGTGQTTIVAGSGVTVNVNADFTLKLAGRYSVAVVIKDSTDVWTLFGDLEAA